MIGSLALAVLFLGTPQDSGQAPRPLTIYYIPFHVETLVGVTTKTIRERAQTRFRVEAEEGISRVLQAVATETPGVFFPGHVRLLVEQQGQEDLFVDAEGHVLREGRKFTLGVAKFAALRTLLEGIAPPS